jgi:prevent-host-death family protein
MDVAVSTLRAELSSWIERAKAGEDVVITERGIPVARILAVDSAPLLDHLTQRGLLSKPSTTRPKARGARRAHPTGSVSELVGQQRR